MHDEKAHGSAMHREATPSTVTSTPSPAFGKSQQHVDSSDHVQGILKNHQHEKPGIIREQNATGWSRVRVKDIRGTQWPSFVGDSSHQGANVAVSCTSKPRIRRPNTQSKGTSIFQGLRKSRLLGLHWKINYDAGHQHEANQKHDGKSGRRCAPSLVEPRYPGKENEYCTRCSREAAWQACDVFWSFDITRTGEITRQQYVISLAQHPTVQRLRFLRRANLESRFRGSARPVKLEEFLLLIWPKASEDDLRMIRCWANLREAWNIVHDPDFRGLDQEMRRIFDLLDQDRSAEVPLGEFVRADILNREDLMKCMRTKDLNSRVSMEAYKSSMVPYLKTMYVTADTMKKLKADEDAQHHGQMASNLDSMFHRSK